MTHGRFAKISYKYNNLGDLLSNLIKYGNTNS